MYYVMLFIGMIVLLSPKYLYDSWVPTLTEADYSAVKMDAENELTDIQIIFKECSGDKNDSFRTVMQIYGNGNILIYKYEYLSDDKTKDYLFYHAYEDQLPMEIAEEIIQLGLFEAESRLGYPYATGIRYVYESYYLSLRCEDEYYTIYFNGKENEEFEWNDITECVKSSVDIYMNEDYEISGSEYLDVREAIIDEYGELQGLGDSRIHRWVEENEECMSESV